eukprot:12594559-Ditylum_brightwellii.AAC.1
MLPKTTTQTKNTPVFPGVRTRVDTPQVTPPPPKCPTTKTIRAPMTRSRLKKLQEQKLSSPVRTAHVTRVELPQTTPK